MTQSEAGGIGWPQIIGATMGAGLVVVTFATLAWFKHRSKAARNERPPQSAKLLRPAGHSLHCWIDELAEKRDSAVMQSVMAGGMLGLLCSAFYPIIEGLMLQRVTFNQIRAQPKFYILWSLAALIISALAW